MAGGELRETMVLTAPWEAVRSNSAGVWDEAQWTG